MAKMMRKEFISAVAIGRVLVERTKNGRLLNVKIMVSLLLW